MLKDIFIDTCIDNLRVLPFLFFACLFIEFLEYKTSGYSHNLIKRKTSVGPFFGGFLGAFPQCGFSAAASNLYSSRVITIGTLISIYLSTSDEMLPILLSEKVSLIIIGKIIAIKIFIGILSGFIIDFLFYKREKNLGVDHQYIHNTCKHKHCSCQKHLLSNAIIHTLSILFFIFIISFLLNLIIETYGEDSLSSIIINKPIISHLLSGLIGLIPNCAASVVITKLYLEQVLSLGAMLAGLLTGAGIGVLVLFRTNKHPKENLLILLTLYLIGVFSGIIIDFM